MFESTFAFFGAIIVVIIFYGVFSGARLFSITGFALLLILGLFVLIDGIELSSGSLKTVSEVQSINGTFNVTYNITNNFTSGIMSVESLDNYIIVINATDSKFSLNESALNATALAVLPIYNNGTVITTGTPANNQLAIWTNANTLEGDADITYNGNVFIADTTMRANYYQGTAVTHPANSIPFNIPFFMNDIANNVQRGGTATVTSSASVPPTCTGDTILFDGLANMCYFTGLTASDYVQMDINFSEKFTYGYIVAFDMGLSNYRAKNFTVEVFRNDTGSWQSLANITEYANGLYSIKNFGSAGGIQGMRLNFTNFAHTTFRPAEVFLWHSGGGMGSEYFVTTAGNSRMYGNLRSGANATYDIGEATNAWNNVYAITYNDLTPAWKGTPQEALTAIIGLKNKNGEIDHLSYPTSARNKFMSVETEEGEIIPIEVNESISVEQQKAAAKAKVEAMGKTVVSKVEPQTTYTRDIGGTLTMALEAIKELSTKISALEAENALMKTELCTTGVYSWCK